MRAIITVVGKDKKGIIAGVSTELCANEINILDINQTIMSEFFTMVMLVDLSGMPVSIDELKTRLDSLGEDYTEEAILQRLRRQRGVTAAIPPEQSESKRYYTIRRRPRHYLPVKRGSFRALYLYYLYLLSPRKRKPQKIPFETRAEIRRAKQYRQPCEQPR